VRGVIGAFVIAWQLLRSGVPCVGYVRSFLRLRHVNAVLTRL
jgi:hypothetical protein